MQSRESLTVPNERSYELGENWSAVIFRGAICLGLISQLFLLGDRADGQYVNGLFGWFSLLYGVALFFPKTNLPGWLKMAIIAGTVGGAAMALGDYIDCKRSNSLMNCCLANVATVQVSSIVWLNWSNGLMGLACVISCLCLCPERQGGLCKPTMWLRCFCCLGGMWLGMILGGHLLIDRFRDMFGPLVGMHISMVFGMMTGATVSHMFFWPKTRLQ